MTSNHLLNETSPYLAQHVSNPVDWYPWCETVFLKAVNEDKPIFLSIGYSTCHWCHVMAHESFEDPIVAKLLNDHYVCIKLDREEHPDIDAIYMTVCQMMTGGGGWPLTIVMTPEKKPFFAGTYFPKYSVSNRVGMLDLLPRLTELWQTNRADIDRQAALLLEELTRDVQIKSSGTVLTEDMLNTTVMQLKQSFDSVNGGFGPAPKFPTPHHFLFLLKEGFRCADLSCSDMVFRTLEKMRLGGIFDQIGGGFHRYTTDEKWLLPHFEKMLYDQALLLMAYGDAFSYSHDDRFLQVVLEIHRYLREKLFFEEGAYYCGEDADSEGEEGKFYVWGFPELKQLLNQNEFDLVVKLFQLEEVGKITRLTVFQ